MSRMAENGRPWPKSSSPIRLTNCEFYLVPFLASILENRKTAHFFSQIAGRQSPASCTRLLRHRRKDKSTSQSPSLGRAMAAKAKSRIDQRRVPIRHAAHFLQPNARRILRPRLRRQRLKANGTQAMLGKPAAPPPGTAAQFLDAVWPVQPPWRGRYAVCRMG